MNAIQRHLAAYSEAYFVGLLFVLLQVALAFVAQAAGLTLAVRLKMDAFDWLVFKAQVAIACIPTIIAFLNGSVARGKANSANLSAGPDPLGLRPAPALAPAASSSPPAVPAQPQA